MVTLSVLYRVYRLFHFGLNDGVYLKIGGTEYEDMDKKLLGGQFWFGALFQSVIAIGIVLWTVLSGNGVDTEFVFIMTAVYMLLYNLTLYLGCVFQAANETRLYSLSVMIDKIVFMVSILALFIVKAAITRPMYGFICQLSCAPCFTVCTRDVRLCLPGEWHLVQ